MSDRITENFDDLSRSIAEGSSRRRILQSLLGGGVAALIATIGLGGEDVEAARGRNCRRRCRRRFPNNRRRRERCLRRCRRGGGGGGGGCRKKDVKCARSSQCCGELLCLGVGDLKVCAAL